MAPRILDLGTRKRWLVSNMLQQLFSWRRSLLYSKSLLHVPKTSPLVLALGEMNHVHIFKPISLRCTLIFSFHLHLRLSRGLFHSGLRTNISVHLSHAYYTSHSTLFISHYWKPKANFIHLLQVLQTQTNTQVSVILPIFNSRNLRYSAQCHIIIITIITTTFAPAVLLVIFVTKIKYSLGHLMSVMREWNVQYLKVLNKKIPLHFPTEKRAKYITVLSRVHSTNF